MTSTRGTAARHERNLERNIGSDDRFTTDASATTRVESEDDGAARMAREAAQREAARRAVARNEAAPPA